MDSKALCLRILDAESERQVYDIVNDVPELLDSGNWFPIDGRETNFNVVTNQASTGSTALTELCTNMVDAILMKHAYLNGVDPLGPAAPRSVIEGVRDLVRLPGARSGILAEVDADSYLKEFAEKNLVIGVTGGRRGGVLPCFTFVDNGEGQDPDKFETTFLSLSAGNKSNIPFVQGKYNMGASGVLTYCGDHWYKLIISRRYDGSDGWGWTLVRRRPGGGMPVAEYFKPNGAIPSFPATDLRPMRMQNREQDDRVQCSTGTVVKLYDYQMGSATSFRNIRESINENLVSTILPFRLMDYRQTPDPRRGGVRALGIDERSVNGMEFLLLRKDGTDETETSEEEQAHEPGQDMDIGGFEHPDLGRISIRAIVLRRKMPGWLAHPRNTSRVFHAVNGQVQFKENRAYLSQRCNLPVLKDRVVIIVDASDLTEAAHNDVWKADRENVRATRIGQLYRDKVTDIIMKSPHLKEWQQRIAQEEMESLPHDSQAALFQNLVEADPSIAQLLPGGTDVTLPGYIGRDLIGEEWQGEYSPTFLDLAARSIKENGADIAIDGERRIELKTDVVNGYFNRPDNRGRLFTTGMDGKFSHSHALRDGRLTITFATMPDRAAIGEEVTFALCLLDDAMPEPVTENLTLRIIPVRKMQKPGQRGQHRKINPDAEGEETTATGRALPPMVWLTRDGRVPPPGDTPAERWPEDFTDQDGGYVEDFGSEGRKFYINYDNAHFRRVLNAERNDIGKKVITEQYRVAMLVLMLGFEEAYGRMETSEAKDAIDNCIDEIRRLSAHGAATVVMSIAKTLSTIINPTSVTDHDD